MMSYKPTIWSDDLSDDYNDTSGLLNVNVNTYESTQASIRDHEEGLSRLGEAIKRQKNMANEFATEVELHNEILDEIDTGLTNTDQNLNKNIRNIKLISRKSGNCFLWLMIFLLAIVIVFLAII